MLDTEATLVSHRSMEKPADAAAAATTGDRNRARGAPENALASLSGPPRPNAESRPLLPRGGLAPWKARRVAAYVQENIGGSLRASELSRLVRLSYSHFNRAFKVSFHQTPTSYIMTQRVKLAQEKMLTTAKSLSQVALECGLCDQAHFSRMFRRIVGQSPRLWRTQLFSDSQPSPAKPAH